MPLTTRRHLLALLAAAPVVAAGACSPGTESSEKGSPGSGTGGRLQVGAISAGGEAVTDPHGSLFSESDWVRAAAIYDPLIGIDEDGELAPGIATDWTPEKGTTQWRLRLREDAKFSDGSAVTSADVMYSLGRIADKADENGGRLGTVDIDRSSAPDAHTVLLRTSVADAELPRTLGGTSFIVPKGAKDFDKAIGSGPFTLVSTNSQGALLRRHDGWWGDVTLDELLVRPFSDPSAMTRAITSGAIDVALGVEPTAAKSVQGRDDLQVVRRRGESTTPLLMRLDEAPFDDEDVREAFRLAIDRKALVSSVYLGFGEVGADLPQPNDPSAPKLTAPARDVERAKKLLARAGHGNGLDVELHTTTAYASMPSTAKLVARQLRDVGVRVEVVSHQPQTYWTKTYGQVPFSVGYYSQMPYPVWVRQTALSTSAFNETGWEDKEFDKDFATAMATTDEGRRHALLAKMQERMAQEGGIIAWGHGDGLTIAAKSVRRLPTASGLARLRFTSVTT